jgi:hypothetical protein
MHWTPKLERLRDEYVKRAIGVEEAQATPPVRVFGPRTLYY